MKKQYFLVLDTETTQSDHVADFGAVIVDKKGKVYSSISVLVDGIYGNENHPLFFDPASKDGIWSKKSRKRREENYDRHLLNGTRMLASVSAINKWLVTARLTYPNIIWTAYNSAFDLNKCSNSGIDLSVFGSNTFCLWQAAYTQFAHTKKFRNFCLGIHAFNPPTKYGNMTYKTNAETMARFVLNNPTMPDEPHTAFEDLDYEVPILLKLLKLRSTKWILESPKAYNWRAMQVRDNFTSI